MQTHEDFMQHTFRLAMRGIGKVSPNPRVGCTIVKDGRIIGEGWHREFGGHHAEVDALNRCTEDPKGAIAYVNLEPCSHVGKTPPCAPLLIQKGISKVVIAMQDPNPLVAGKGITLLREAGIEVIENICKEEAFWLNRFFVKHILTGMPYIIGKIAQSLDGCIATSTGESKWITCEESRHEVHRMRGEIDAVMIGRGTAGLDAAREAVLAYADETHKHVGDPFEICRLDEGDRCNTTAALRAVANRIDALREGRK